MFPAFHVLHLRPGLIVIGAALLAAQAASAWRAGRGLASWPDRARVRRLSEAHFGALLALLTGAFLCAATLAKLSQLRALALNSEDFWLFEDMLEQMLHGGFFLTRFAPQAIGWVQHGAIHPFLSWVLAIPLAWLAGPTGAALSFGPLVLGGAGALLGTLARPRWGAPGALAAAAAFLASSQVARILMYDVHPESSYPLLVFLWAWAAGWGTRDGTAPHGGIRPGWLLAATVLLMGVKEDSFLVLPPLLLATALSNRSRWLALSAVVAAAALALQFYVVHQWTSGAWGPHRWQGEPVLLTRGPAIYGGRHFDSMESAARILAETVSQRGGPAGILAGLARFLTSSPWLSLLAVAPWVALLPAFWISVLPLVGVYSLLEMPGKFLVYYSAPVLGLFWLSAVSGPRKPGMSAWVLCASLLLGGSGIDFHFPTPAATRARQEIRAEIPCLRGKRGMVTGPFLGLVPRENVRTDRVTPERLDAADFYLFAPGLPSFEVPSPVAEPLLSALKHDPHWTRIGPGCQPVDENNDQVAMLFMKNPS